MDWTTLEYGQLLAHLRKDLQLNLLTDVQHGSLDDALADLVSKVNAQHSLGIQAASGSLVWPGASRLTNVLTVTFATPYSTAPLVVVSAFGTTNLAPSVVTETATNFTAQGNTIDGSSPAPATARSFNWIAIGS